MKPSRHIFCPILFIFVCFSALDSHAQFGVSYHQSGLPFAGVNYEIADRYLVELRLSTDIDLEFFTPELAASYQFLDKVDYEIYGGLGLRVTPSEFGDFANGVVLPIGAHFFPFEQKNFGFHVELAPIFIFEGGSLLRGSWGIRYRFGSTNAEE